MPGRKRGGNRGHSGSRSGGSIGRPSAADNARHEADRQELTRLERNDPVLDGLEDGEDPEDTPRTE